MDPSTDKLRRVKVKVNHVKKPSERERFARALCNAINTKLYDGWNPFIETLNASSVTIADAINLFMDAKSKFSRKSTIRSYKSYCETFHLPIYYYVMQPCYRLLMRPNEIVQLRISDIDFDDGMIRVRSEVAKNHGERLLAVPEDMMVYFRELAGYPPHYFVFADCNTYKPGPRQMYPTRIAEKWKEMRDELNLPASYQFYSLKDTGITELLEAGVPAKIVKELADHSSLEMTEKYLHKSNAKKILEYNTLKF